MIRRLNGRLRHRTRFVFDGAFEMAVPCYSRLANRPARALIGWMATNDALLALNGRRADVQPTGEQIAFVEQAAAAVAARPVEDVQADVLSGPPEVLDQHVASLHANPGSASLFAAGADVQLIRLDRVFAFQPLIHLDSAAERVSGVAAEDWPGLASICLPLTTKVELPAVHDHVQKAWVIVTQNPNIKLGSNFNAMVQITPGSNAPGFGFTLNVGLSFINVGRFQGRYFLRDGYHRCLGLLMAGITQVPGLVSDVAEIEQLAPAGMLPQAAYLGAHPPRLTDYLDDHVSARVDVPASDRMIIVQGMDFGFMA
jgi:hypothetical protein